MKALVFRGERQMAVEEVAEATPRPEEVLIEVAYCGICGSDLHGFLGHSARRTRSIPLIMGHEFSGRVAALGSAVPERFSIGQRVTVQPEIGCGICPACRAGRVNICPNMKIIGIERAGAFAPLVAVPADRVFPIPDSLSDTAATLVETLAVEVHLFRMFVPSLLRTVLILGAGAQGLLAIQLARLAGIPEILVSDIEPARLALAQRLGATTALNAREVDVAKTARERTDGWGVEAVIETTGAPPARIQGLAALAVGGTMGVIGLGEGPTTVDFLPLVARELSVRGSYCYTDDDFVRSIELLASGQVRAEEMLTILPLRQGVEAFTRLVDAPGDLVKVVLQPA
jgi:2-desacetyl-2-hydroxyethyl bacteriochlorophyllide A dehydrogenase